MTSHHFPDEDPPPVVHGIFATWWTATFDPREFADSLAQRNPRVSPWVYVPLVTIAGLGLAAGVLYLQVANGFGELGLANQVGPVVCLGLIDVGLRWLMALAAAGLSAAAVGRTTGVAPQDALATRAYATGPVTNLYAWWVMYLWMCAMTPSVRHPARHALLGLSLELGIALALFSTVLDPLRDLLSDALS